MGKQPGDETPVGKKNPNNKTKSKKQCINSLKLYFYLALVILKVP